MTADFREENERGREIQFLHLDVPPPVERQMAAPSCDCCTAVAWSRGARPEEMRDSLCA